jgi:hypothetical protein
MRPNEAMPSSPHTTASPSMMHERERSLARRAQSRCIQHVSVGGARGQSLMAGHVKNDLCNKIKI